MGVTRSCGTRCPSGVYAEVGLSPYGMPIEEFYVDPPIILNKTLGLTQIGVKLIEKNGVWHIFDWVGTEHYPNVADFLEEMKVHGLSRRLSKKLQFDKLTKESMIFLVHSKAWNNNHFIYKTDHAVCPCNKQDHNRFLDRMCARMWWLDVEGIEVDNSITVNNVIEGTRVTPSVKYEAKCYDMTQFSAARNQKHSYEPAIFARFPISNLCVIRDKEDGTHEESLAVARNSSLPVLLKDE